MLKKIKENKAKIKSQLLYVGSLLLIVIGSFLIFFKYYQIYTDYKKEQILIDNFIEEQKDYTNNNEISKETEEIVEEENIEENIPKITEKFIAVIEIPKIDLRKGLYSKNSSLNNVNKNIKILKESSMPNEIKGNFILASHSGSSKVAYFNNLKKLNINDIAYVYYEGGRFAYKLVNVYEIKKTGKANIIRNASKTTMTLITCITGTNKQIVYIFELMEDNNE